MNFQYEYNENQRELAAYSMGLMVFVSTFFINIKLIGINIIWTLVLYGVLSLSCCIFILNIRKYSLFKYDIIVFMIIFYTFSIFLLVEMIKSVWNGQTTSGSYILFYITIFINLINAAVFLFKIANTEHLHNYRILYVLSVYIFFCIMMILIFASVYIGTANQSISNFINQNFTYDMDKSVYLKSSSESYINDYLSYGKPKVVNLTDGQFTLEQLKGYIETNFAPVNKIEDYIFFSAQSLYGGGTENIVSSGSKIRYLYLSERLIFIIVTLVVLSNLTGIYKLTQDY